jgi:hypothetical protein
MESTRETVVFFLIPTKVDSMKHLVAALVLAAFAAVSIAQGTAPATPAVKSATATPAAPATTGTKKAKKKKAKKSKGAANVAAPAPTK